MCYNVKRMCIKSSSLRRGGFRIRQKNTDKDIVTYEHKVIVTKFLDRRTQRHSFSRGDIVTKEHMTMLLTDCSFVTLSYL